VVKNGATYKVFRWHPSETAKESYSRNAYTARPVINRVPDPVIEQRTDARANAGEGLASAAVATARATTNFTTTLND
jgi:hypothetical protein